MNNSKSRFLFPLILLFVLVYALSNPLFGLPPLGKLFNPFIGAVQNNNVELLNAAQYNVHEMNLNDSVKIFFDERKVPHIYAKNKDDLYFAQGYVTAYLRLWQIDFLSYTISGRLSELFADDMFLDFDKNQRRIGILDAAKRSLRLIEKDKETIGILSAYTRGINSFIKKIKYKDLPLEYKLLDYKPELWSNLKTVLIMKQLGNTLSGYEEDMFLSKMILAIGEENFHKLYPDFPPDISPIVESESGKTNESQFYLKIPGYLNYSFLSSSTALFHNTYNPKLGSNSWAVSGDKTESGFPILANDPHLSLSLPNIWIEMQLNCPGLNVYGVSIPGTPSIIIGFNNDIAWGITNGADDAKDWYKLNVNYDSGKYQVDNKWLKLKSRVEVIKRRDKKPISDTVYSTIYGPIVSDNSYDKISNDLRNYSLNWGLHSASNEFLAFLKLNRAKNYNEYWSAIKNISSPILNFTFAGKDNTIAVNHIGKMPFKYPGQGKFIMDGSKSSSFYSRYIPLDSLPKIINPDVHYVFSANQHPTSNTYPYYYNGYYSQTRSKQIKKMLESESKFNVKKTQLMQLNNVNYFAVEAIPLLVSRIQIQKLSDKEIKMLTSLELWNGAYDIDDTNGRLFDLWISKIRNFTWEEFLQYDFYLRAPSDFILLELIRNDPDNKFFDIKNTVLDESSSDIITKSFIAAYKEYSNSKKQWRDLNRVDIMHMTNIPSFSKINLPSPGHPEAINAVSRNWGPSWRMIVELGNRPKAFGIYPGGQSGGVGNRYYDNFINDWLRGSYYPLNFYMSLKEAESNSTNLWILN